MTKFRGICMGTLILVLALALPAAAQNTITLTTTLYGSEEQPAINTGAVGTAEASVDVVNREILVTLKVFNIPTTTTAGHIHIGPIGIGGPVVVNFPAAVAGRTGDFAMSFRIGEREFVARPAIGI